MSTLESIKNEESIIFADLLLYIDANYTFTPTAFRNGALSSSTSENQGSQKVFAFARLNALTKEQTLYCFGEHYQDVLSEPEGDSHDNIRNFMHSGWEGYSAEGTTLVAK